MNIVYSIARMAPVLIEIVAETSELGIFRKMELANKLRTLLKCKDEL